MSTPNSVEHPKKFNSKNKKGNRPPPPIPSHAYDPHETTRVISEERKHKTNEDEGNVIQPKDEQSIDVAAEHEAAYELQYEAEMERAIRLSVVQQPDVPIAGGDDEVEHGDEQGGELGDGDEDEEWPGLAEILQQSASDNKQVAQPKKAPQQKQQQVKKKQKQQNAHGQQIKKKKNRKRKPKKPTTQQSNQPKAPDEGEADAGGADADGEGEAEEAAEEDEVDEDLELALQISRSQYEESSLEDELLRTAISESIQAAMGDMSLQQNKGKQQIYNNTNSNSNNNNNNNESSSSSSSSKKKKKYKTLVLEDEE